MKEVNSSIYFLPSVCPCLLSVGKCVASFDRVCILVLVGWCSIIHAFSDVSANLHFQLWLQTRGKDFCTNFKKDFSLWLQVVHTFKHANPTQWNFMQQRTCHYFNSSRLLWNFCYPLPAQLIFDSCPDHTSVPSKSFTYFELSDCFGPLSFAHSVPYHSRNVDFDDNILALRPVDRRCRAAVHPEKL
jgi:hypothetical protein